MAYTERNFNSKKDLKKAVAAGDVSVFNPLFGAVKDGMACIEGPHYPESPKWYARVEVKGGVISKGSKVH